MSELKELVNDWESRNVLKNNEDIKTHGMVATFDGGIVILYEYADGVSVERMKENLLENVDAALRLIEDG